MSRPLLVFALAFLAVGCSDPEPTDDGEVATFEETTFSDDTSSDGALMVRAVFLGPMYDGDAMMVEHEEIPDLMPAMRMPFTLERPDLIAGLSEGDKVLLTIGNSESGPGLIVTAIEPLPPDTELDLEGAEADSVFVPGAE
ncbi:MAG: hypothetical protein Rubg2KO_41200 [Rubricoccaceae bacterium]